MKLIAIAVATALLAPVWSEKDLDPPRTVQFEGAQFDLVTGRNLGSMLLGHSMQATPCNDSSQCIEAFFERGQYSRSEDRGVIHGTYALQHDRYCAGWDDYRFCAAVYQSKDGRLATTNLKCGPPCLTLVKRRDESGPSEFTPSS